MYMTEYVTNPGGSPWCDNCTFMIIVTVYFQPELIYPASVCIIYMHNALYDTCINSLKKLSLICNATSLRKILGWIN
jgi:hypothetical protein